MSKRDVAIGALEAWVAENAHVRNHVRDEVEGSRGKFMAEEKFAEASAAVIAGLVLSNAEVILKILREHREAKPWFEESNLRHQACGFRFIVKDPDGAPIAVFLNESDARRFYAPLANHGFQTLPEV